MPKLIDGADYGWTYMFDCPGCGSMHGVNTTPNNGQPCWSFNGNMEKPTFKPSIRVSWNQRDVPKCCHFFITDGKIQYLEDCTHELKGQTVDMPEEF